MIKTDFDVIESKIYLDGTAFDDMVSLNRLIVRDVGALSITTKIHKIIKSRHIHNGVLHVKMVSEGKEIEEEVSANDCFKWLYDKVSGYLDNDDTFKIIVFKE